MFNKHYKQNNTENSFCWLPYTLTRKTGKKKREKTTPGLKMPPGRKVHMGLRVTQSDWMWNQDASITLGRGGLVERRCFIFWLLEVERK